MLARTVIDSPVGRLTLVAGDEGLVAVLWPDDDPARVPLPSSTERADHPVLVESARQLADYFVGRRESFTIALDFRGTLFQVAVWRALLDIPFGETRTYADVARRIGRPDAVRAVGAANGRNPISIIAPCHRVVGSGGALTGFAGGLAAKRVLLDLERRDQQLWRVMD
ncbi:methylated-DNA--[protein]-cysteine S-methyltransferase [uncultured Sphingomonas sp.]|uniref:methylated-DNA--[protein]-cysteine S-methyltransferase n=1 Tax=uncultured Sphingomonas sp. TaxID=158754 RepID=UPI0025EFA082|nr:methylated-DNA--[protein]-cysteine S-methyltransferase [uncultured Sphingomonas sp.]